MSKEIKSKRYQGVYFRELEGGDRSYFLRFRLNGTVRRFPIGKKSEGITEAFCAQEKTRIMNEARFGEVVAAGLQKVKKEDPTFWDLVQYYIEHNNLKPATVYSYEQLKHVPFLSSRKVTKAEVVRHIDDYAKTVTPGSVIVRLKRMRTVYKFAIAREFYRHANPTEGVPLPKSDSIRRRYLTADEINLLLHEVQDKPRVYLFVRMALCTGARSGTLLTVRAEDVKPDGSVSLINHKIGRRYTGFFDAETMDLIAGKEGWLLARKGKEHDPEPPHKNLVSLTLQKVLDQLFNPPGTHRLDRVVVHTLRHSVATQQIRKGVPMEVISKTLDHSSVAITSQVYAKVTPDVVKRSVTDLWN